MKRWIKKLLKISGCLLLVLAVALAAGYSYLNTQGGRKWLARTINNAASDPKTGVSVIVEGIEGSIPWDMRIRRVKLGDAQGEYASLSVVHFGWAPGALFHKQIHVLALEADEINVLRAPLLPQEKPAPPPQPFSLPKLPDIAVDTLRISSLFIGEALAGTDQRFSVDGGGTPADWKLSLKTLQGPATSLHLTLNLLPASLRAHMEMDEEPGGILLHMLKQSGASPLHLALDANSDAAGLVHLQQMNLTFSGLSLGGQGSYNLSDSRSDAKMTLGVADAAVFSDLAGTPLAGKIDAAITADGPPDALAVKLDAALEKFIAGTTLVPAAKTALAATVNIPKKSVDLKDSLEAAVNGTPVSLQVEALLQDAHVKVKRMEAGYGPYRVQANGEADKDSRRFKVALVSTLPALSVMAPQLHLEGSGQAKLDAEGTFDTFRLDAQADITSKEGDAKLTAHGDVEPTKKSFEGKVNADARRSGQRFTLALPLKATPAEVNVTDAAFDGPGMKLAATLRWSLADRLGNGTLSLNAPDLRPLGILAGQKLAGQVNADIKLLARDKKESAAVKMAAKNIEANGTALSQASLMADVQDLFGKLSLNARLAAGPLVSGSTHMEKLALEANGTPSQAMTVTLNSNGNAAGKPFSVALSGGSRRDAKDAALLHAKLDKFTGVYDAAPITLEKPAEVTLGKDVFALSPLSLKLADGVITASGNQRGGKLSAQLEIKHLHLDKLPAASLPQGTLDAKLGLKGTPAAPEATLSSALLINSGGQKMAAHASADWRKNLLSFKSDASLGVSKLNAELAIHAPLSLVPFVADINATTPVQGKAVMDAALESFNPFLRASGQRVSGKIAGNVKITGRLAEPTVDGHVTLHDGKYDHDDIGVCMRGMNAEIEGSGDHVALKRLDASSADGGGMHAEGSALLGGDKGLQGKVAFHNYRLFCGGLLNGAVEGDLAASGTLDAAMLAGTLTFPHMNIELPGNSTSGANIPSVKTVRVNPRAAHAAQAAAAPGTGSAPLKLGVNVHVPNQMFVRGRGLDAEFAGDLAINGAADNPVISGLFESKRGQFELLDKTLKLISAQIRFQGTIPPSPFLDIKAESVTSAITIDVNLSGPAANPAFTLSSTPSLPQDEILAQLLFGRELSNLGPFQVAQLAQATATLSGYSSGPGVMGKVRGLLGVDTLNVGNDSTSGVNVGAGKYITDKIYVGVTQGAKPESRAVTTEIEVYPHVSATTGVTATGQQNLGVQWKYDY